VRLLRLAPQAGAKPGPFGLGAGAEKAAVGAERLPRGADRSAIDSCGRDGDVEHTVKRGVAGIHGVMQRLKWNISHAGDDNDGARVALPGIALQTGSLSRDLAAISGAPMLPVVENRDHALRRQAMPAAGRSYAFAAVASQVVTASARIGLVRR
jgi:hypothetical protein